uniref:Cytochrome P450 n=1 Tax=Globisporangium ultimum (strain ATCC 200006 / CBS 805.95 / DAOM BR144) TaxID=431595 RepID=K3XBX5_GLOUD
MVAVVSTLLRTATWADVTRALLCLAVVALLSIPLRALRRKLRIARGLAPLKGPKGAFLLGNIPNFIKHKDRIYDFLEERLHECGGIMKMPWHLFFDGAIYISDPEHVKHILATNFDNYVKPQGFLDAFHEVFAHSFFATNHAHNADNGAKWRLQRKVAAKVFTTSNFRHYTEHVFAKYTQEMVETIDACMEKGQSCDMQALCAQYTLRSIFDIAFGIPLEDVVDPLEFANRMDFVNAHCASRLFVKQYYKLLKWVMPSEHRLKRETDAIRGIADAILARRLDKSDDDLAARSDILSLFIQKARELEKGESDPSLLCVDTLRSIILTFIFAGRDTTAECITYTFYGIARHPHVQRKIVEELQTVLNGTGDASLSYSDVRQLKYLDAVVYEAIRLYPALPYNVKMAVNDDHLPDGTFVPAGVDVVYSPWYMGRHNAIWGDDPLEFRPERWLEMKTRPSAFEFPAFQAGPRVCIGMSMALLEAKMCVAGVLHHVDVRIPASESQERGYVLKSGLFMAGGLPLESKRRDAGAA